ncbi:MAG: hypothetical protein ABEJ56_01110 [Candidatus Nanohaloarchaea archaeon]
MAEDRVREFVRRKLDQGVDPGELESVLEEKGFDPGIVSQVMKQRQGTNNTSNQTSVVEEAERIEQLASGLEQKAVEKRKNIAVMAGISVFLIVLVGLSAAFLVDDAGRSETSGKADAPEQKANLSGIKNVVLEEGVARPSRVRLVSRDKLVFVNRNSYPLEIRFDSGGKLRVPAGGSREAGFNSITYYEAVPLGEGESIQGSVYVE